ncbi:MAG: siderophore-interacting protein [Rhodobacteraceae bacterium]|nr:siderophore-interacting protein [Paracoccaceae bacterium]
MSRTAVVKSVSDVTPNMRRIVFGGADIADFPQGKEGGYIKFVFPDEPRVKPDRPIMRTYSIRAHDSTAGEITVDFAMHADTGGIAIDWATNAQPGDEIPINGPGSIKMAPPDADWYLIAGDMTAQPAAMCNLEMLPDHATGYVVLEVTSEEDKQELSLPEGMELHWVINPSPHSAKEKLLEKIQRLPWRDGEPFVWTACEFDTMRALRTYYRTDRQVAKDMFYLSSYWRSGRTEDQHKVDKNKDAQATDSTVVSLAKSVMGGV